LPVGVDLRHDGSEGTNAVVTLQARHIKMDSDYFAMAREVADKQSLLLMDEGFALRTASRAQSGDGLGFDADMVFGGRLTEIHNLQTGQIQEVHRHSRSSQT